MASASYVLVINIALSTFVVAGFLTAYLHDRRRTQILFWMAAAAFVLLTGLIEAVMPFLHNSPILRVAGFVTFLAGIAFLNIGIARQYKAEIPHGGMAALAVGSLILNVSILDMERNSLVRMALYQAPYFLMGMTGFAMILRARRKQTLDYLFLGIVLLLNLHILTRPLAAHLMGGMGADAGKYLATPYGQYDQTMLAILAIALVAALAMLIARDVFSSLVKVSVTDPLSGLLNRRGFLERAKGFIQLARPSGQEVFLVIADIDHFKAINDKFGHEAGDRVIQAFGNLLGTLSTAGTSVARIGGEEFAVLFASPNTAVARLYCESIRTAAELGAADKDRDLPRFTVSIGLAGLTPGESLESLMRRADLALYGAKEDGRNCVSVAEASAAVSSAKQAA